MIKIKVNDLAEVSKTINAGDRMLIETPVNNSNVNITYTRDRRLVILETIFSRRNQMWYVEHFTNPTLMPARAGRFGVYNLNAFITHDFLVKTNDCLLFFAYSLQSFYASTIFNNSLNRVR